MKGLSRGFIYVIPLFVMGACRNDAQKIDSIFEEVSEETGLQFVHDNGWSGKYYMPEIMGAGGALFDFDNDGDLDIYLCQGFQLERPETGSGGRLFANSWSQNGKLGFVDVTEASGIRTTGYGMGAVVGDINNDGLPDLYLTNYGTNQMYLNRGGGVFEDVTASAGMEEPRWSVSAAFVDYDRDGWLDLYIGNYVNFSFTTHKDCYLTHLDFCHPNSYDPQPDRLLRNQGDGTFADVTAESGVAEHFGNALGVAACDFNDDGWPDIYVANDANPNNLWINQKDGTFKDQAMIAGCALNHDGAAESSMGVDAGDYDEDGDLDLFMTHLTSQTNTLYGNDGSGMFEDRTIVSGLGPPSKPFTGFGVAWFDYDNDGFLDLFIANGTVTALPLSESDSYPYHQTNQLFQNLGDQRFREVSKLAGLTLSEVSRSALFGDLDNDGDVDIVVTNNRGPVRVLRNKLGARNHWIGLRVVDSGQNRYAIGARLSLKTRTGSAHWRSVVRNTGYASSNDPRVIVGLAQNREPCILTVLWPDGSREIWKDLNPGQWHTIKKGEGLRDSGLFIKNRGNHNAEANAPR